jgi:prolyl oligopeptidase
MNKIGMSVLPVACVILVWSSGAKAAGSWDYPKAYERNTVDTYQGSLGPVQVADPYRWMENPDATDTQKWVTDENAITKPYLEGLPGRDAIRDRIAKIRDYDTYGLPVKVGGKYFYTRRTGLQNQPVIYVSPALDQVGKVLIDPNPLSPDSTTAIDPFVVSPEGKYIAYGLQEKGTDWRRYKLRDVASGQDLSDEILFVKYSTPVVWAKDEKSFFYTRYPEPTGTGDVSLNSKIYVHHVGQAQSQDTLVYELPEHPDWWKGVELSKDDRWLILMMEPNNGLDETAVLYKDLSDPASAFVELVRKPGKRYDYVGSEGSALFFVTNDVSGNKRVVSIDASHPETITQVVPAGDLSIDTVGLVAKRLVVSYLKDAHSQVKIIGLDGAFIREVQFPEPYVSAHGFAKATDEGETFYSYESFISPATVYQYNLMTGESTLFKKPAFVIDASLYETRQVFYSSKDGTKVPMFIVSKKGVKHDGNNNTLLYAYGGFNISMLPYLSPMFAAWVDRGGVFALPNIRGGGEYGDAWHLAGTKLNKQNVFDDFIAAGEYLISEGYTTSSRLTIRGGSNGGLLMGAMVEQRPDLFAAVLAEVGVMDMLRFNKFTSGVFWTTDYGSPEPLPQDSTHWDAREFDNLYGISPYHQAMRMQVKSSKFPATLVVTADHDDRVVPMHSFKFTAAMQKAQTADEPVLIRIETNAGHGSGVPVSKQIEQVADEMAFAEAAIRAKVAKRAGPR